MNSRLTYRLLDVLIGDGVELKWSLHLKFVSYLDLAFLADFDPSVDFFAPTDPEYLILNLIRSVPNEQLTNGQFELQFSDRDVRIGDRWCNAWTAVWSSRIAIRALTCLSKSIELGSVHKIIIDFY